MYEKKLWWILSTHSININTCTKGGPCHSRVPDLENTLLVPQLWGIGIPDMTIVISTIHIHSQLYLLPQVNECLRNRIEELDLTVRVRESKWAKSKSIFLPCPFYLGSQQKLWPRFWVDLPTSNAPIKKISHRSYPLIGFYLIIDVTKLTRKISQYRFILLSNTTKCSNSDAGSSDTPKLNL